MATSAPTTAIGYTQAPQYSQLAYEDETTPELQWPQSITVYDQMRKTDSQVASVLRAVTLPVRRTPWRIDPNGARAEVVELVADDLGLPIVGQAPRTPPRQKDRFSWSEHLRLALLMLPMGHSYFEQVYRVDDDASRAHLRKLEWRPSKTIADIDVASDGGLVAITQYWTQTNTDPKPIPVSRLVAYVHEREGGNWLGSSILRSAYKNWLLKDRLLRVQAQTIERNGMGIPVYEAAETERSLDTGLGLTQSLRAGAAAGAAIPSGAKLRLMGVEGTLPDADPAIKYHDESIARAVLAHFLNLGTQSGSWALGTTFVDFFTMSLQTLAYQIADVANKHIIEDLVDVNFGEQEPAPRLVFDEIGSRQQATAQAIKLLVDAGLITPDQVLDETLRQQYGLPPADPATAKPSPTQGEPSRAPEPEPVPGEGSVAAAAESSVAAKYDPAQKRDKDGQWTDGTPGSAALDKLKLSNRAPAGFTVRSSKKLKTDYADIGIAEVDSPDGPQVRVGLITAESGRWDAGFSGEARKAELRQQLAEKQARFDSNEEQPDELEDEIAELENELEDLDNERTAILTPGAMADFHRQLGESLELAKANKTKQNATVKALEDLDEQRDEVIAEFSDHDLERRISRLAYQLRQKQGIIKSLERKPNAHGWSDETIAELLVSHRAKAAELEVELAPLLARRAEIVPPEALAQLEELDRQYNTLNDADIDDIITSVEVPTLDGGLIRAEIWGSDDEDSDWVSSRLFVLGAGETTDDAENGDEYASFRGLEGLNKLIAGLDPSGPSVQASRLAAAEAVVAHLSGQHDQKDHGRRLPKSLSGDSPFSGFSRAQLRKAARRRGIELEPREDRASIESKLARHLAEGDDKGETVSKAEPAAPVEVAPDASPARMTKAQYTSLLTDEYVRLSMLRGTSEDDARKQAGPEPSIDDLKERNTVLRAKLRQKGVDYRTEEQKRTDDAEKNRLLDEVERLASEAGHDGPAKRAGASKMSRRELAAFVADATEFQQRRKAKQAAEGKGSSAVAAFKAAEDKSRATSRQVGYIKGLLRERGLSGEAGGPGGGPTSSEGIRKLSNAEARAYINRLLRGDY